MKLSATENTRPPRRPLRERLRRLGLIALAGLFLLYAGFVTAGFVWLRHVRKIDQISIFHVAFFQAQSVRRGLAVQHFARAQREWADRKYQPAYLSFFSGVRNDPDNVAGRLEAVRFFREVGAGNLSNTLLEEGLVRAPEDRRLIEPFFSQLLATGQEKRVLELLERLYGSRYTGSNAPLLQSYELQAVLAVEGPVAARKRLDGQPGLADAPGAAPVVARVLWESAERLRAIDLLARHLRQHDAPYADYALLAGWQTAGGLADQAAQTAQAACEKFPDLPNPRVLRLEMRAAAALDGQPPVAEIEAYLRDFAGQSEPLALLASLAGRKGWVELAGTLYELGATTQVDLGLLALCYGDALGKNSRFKEYQDLLAQVETQLSENSSRQFVLQLRQRQVIVAGALGDTDNVREFSRRLAASVRNDPARLELYRQYFQRMGLAEAVFELGGSATVPKVAASN